MPKEKKSVNQLGPKLKISAKNHTTAEQIKNKELAEKKEAEVAKSSDHLDNPPFKTTRIGTNRGK